jgi:hypothetical protein
MNEIHPDGDCNNCEFLDEEDGSVSCKVKEGMTIEAGEECFAWYGDNYPREYYPRVFQQSKEEQRRQKKRERAMASSAAHLDPTVGEKRKASRNQQQHEKRFAEPVVPVVGGSSTKTHQETRQECGRYAVATQRPGEKTCVGDALHNLLYSMDALGGKNQAMFKDRGGDRTVEVELLDAVQFMETQGYEMYNASRKWTRMPGNILVGLMKQCTGPQVLSWCICKSGMTTKIANPTITAWPTTLTRES